MTWFIVKRDPIVVCTLLVFLYSETNTPFTFSFDRYGAAEKLSDGRILDIPMPAPRGTSCKDYI